MKDQNSKPIWIVGPGGSGKTLLAKNILEGSKWDYQELGADQYLGFIPLIEKKVALLIEPRPHTTIETYLSAVVYHQNAPVIFTAQFTPPDQVREHFQLVNLAKRCAEEDALLPMEVKKGLDRLFMTTIGTDLLLTTDQYKRALSARVNQLLQVLGALRVLGVSYTNEEFIQLLES
ncbi:hypothetical protein [uncultured Algoriphagus sp.]|uniref:hypothetical protein n=1 Tax=uncultured Algoriphagus sp. TaxID=417365 RepID=UPI00259596C4|nr:hypothetical protein [uncultured Algoriphagus sp.]